MKIIKLILLLLYYTIFLLFANKLPTAGVLARKINRVRFRVVPEELLKP